MQNVCKELTNFKNDAELKYTLREGGEDADTLAHQFDMAEVPQTLKATTYLH